MKPSFSIFRDGQYWGVVYRNTVLVLAGESYQVASNVAEACNDPRVSECGEVANVICKVLLAWPAEVR